MNSNKKIYKEDQQLLKDILIRNYYQSFQKRTENKRLEIFLKGSCPNGCNYCYLGKYHTELYPNNLEVNTVIIDNFQKIINWYIENDFVCELDIFSGEWITTDLFEPIFSILYNSFKDLPIVKKPKKIVIPDSMEFLHDINLTNKVQSYLKLFKESQIPIFFSASIDGKYCDFKPISEEKKDIFYNNNVEFLLKNHYNIHPMISSSNVKYWIKNFEWIKQIFSNDYAYNNTFLLEVRDESWTEESIQDYLKFLNFLIEDKFQNQFFNNKEKFLNYIIGANEYKSDNLNQLIQLHDHYCFNGPDYLTCSIQHTLCIRAGDLGIGLCHRLFYDELLIGKFIINNNKINDIEVYNVELQILKDHIKKSCLPICEKCALVNICPSHCLGNSYENFKNPLIPTIEVCNLLKAKYTFLFYKYTQMGLFDILQIKNQNKPNLFYSYLLDLQKNLILDNEVLYYE